MVGLRDHGSRTCSLHAFAILLASVFATEASASEIASSVVESQRGLRAEIAGVQPKAELMPGPGADQAPQDVDQYRGGTTVEWEGGTGYWSDQSFWVPQVVPSNGGETYNVTIGDQLDDVSLDMQATVNSLLNMGTLRLLADSGLTFATASGLTNSGQLRVDHAGTSSLSGAVTNTGLVWVESGTLDMSGSIANSGIIWMGKFSGGDSASIHLSNDLLLSGSGEMYFLPPEYGSSQDRSISVAEQAMFTNGANHRIHGGQGSIVGSGGFTNLGLVSSDAHGETLTISTATFTNAGDLWAQYGNLDVSVDDWSNSGEIQIGMDSISTVTSSYFTNETGGLVGCIAGGELQIGGDVTNLGTLRSESLGSMLFTGASGRVMNMQGASIEADGGRIRVGGSGSYVMNNGTISASSGGQFELASGADLFGGVVDVSGGSSLSAIGGTSNVTMASVSVDDSSRVAAIAGEGQTTTMNMTGVLDTSGTLASIATGDGESVMNIANSLTFASHDGTLLADGGTINVSGGHLVESGTLLLDIRAAGEIALSGVNLSAPTMQASIVGEGGRLAFDGIESSVIPNIDMGQWSATGSTFFVGDGSQLQATGPAVLPIGSQIEVDGSASSLVMSGLVSASGGVAGESETRFSVSGAGASLSLLDLLDSQSALTMSVAGANAVLEAPVFSSVGSGLNLSVTNTGALLSLPELSYVPEDSTITLGQGGRLVVSEQSGLTSAGAITFAGGTLEGDLFLNPTATMEVGVGSNYITESIGWSGDRDVLISGVSTRLGVGGGMTVSDGSSVTMTAYKSTGADAGLSIGETLINSGDIVGSPSASNSSVFLDIGGELHNQSSGSIKSILGSGRSNTTFTLRGGTIDNHGLIEADGGKLHFADTVVSNHSDGLLRLSSDGVLSFSGTTLTDDSTELLDFTQGSMILTAGSHVQLAGAVIADGSTDWVPSISGDSTLVLGSVSGTSGDLYFGSGTLEVGGGLSVAEGATVTVSGGVLRASFTADAIALNGGTLSGNVSLRDDPVPGTMTINGTGNGLVDIDLTSPGDITMGSSGTSSNHSLAVGGGVHNDGIWSLINPSLTAHRNKIIVSDDFVLSGSGSLFLGGSRCSVESINDAIFTNDVGHTIEGSGVFSARLTNRGFVNANQTGESLSLTGTTGESIGGRWTASDGGTLLISGTYDNASGLELSNWGEAGGALDGSISVTGSLHGSFSVLPHAEILLNNGELGGSPTVEESALVTIQGMQNGLDFTSGSLANHGQFLLGGVGTGYVDHQATIGGTVANSGSIVVEDSSISNRWATLQAVSDLTLEPHGVLGGGALTLNGVESVLSSADGVTITNRPGHTINGYGSISGNVINEGLVQATVSGNTLDASGQMTLSAGGVLSALDGATMRVQNLVGEGGMLSLPSGSTGKILLQGGSISGTLTNAADSLLHVSGGSSGPQNIMSFDAFTNLGTVEVGSRETWRTDRASISGNVVNDGEWYVLDSPTSGVYTTVLEASGDLDLRGSGAMTLVGDGAYLSSASTGAATITNHESHTISGYGIINAILDSRGTINGNDAGGQSLILSGSGILDGLLLADGDGSVKIAGNYDGGVNGPLHMRSENSEMAEPVSRLRIEGGSLNCLDVTIGADSTMLVQGGSLTGTWTQGPGAVTTVLSETSNMFNASGGRCTVDGGGEVVVGSGTRDYLTHRLDVQGLFENNGQWTILDESGGTDGRDAIIRAVGDTTFEGAGSLLLTGISPVLTALDGASITQGEGHTIGGGGVISADIINNGTVEASIAGRKLDLTGQITLEASGMLRTHQDATLHVHNLIGNGGHLSGVGTDNVGTVLLQDGSITGSLTNDETGFFRVWKDVGNLMMDVDFVNDGTVSIGSTASDYFRHQLDVSGHITNNGSWQILDPSTQYTSKMNAVGDLDLDGSGSLVLSGDGAYLTSEDGATVTHSGLHTIEGYGSISAALINGATISANVSGRALHIYDPINTSSGVLSASNGGTLRLHSSGEGAQLFRNDGVIEADGGTIPFENFAFENNGTVRSLPGGLVSIDASGSITNEGGRLVEAAGGQITFGGTEFANRGIVRASAGGSVLFSDATQIVNLGGGSFESTGSGSLIEVLGGSSADLGSVTITGGGGLLISDSGTVLRSGVTTIGDGANLTVRNSATVESPITVEDLGLLVVDSGTAFLPEVLTVEDGGVVSIEGVGSKLSGVEEVRNSGTIRGQAGAAGTCHVVRRLFNDPGGVIESFSSTPSQDEILRVQGHITNAGVLSADGGTLELFQSYVDNVDGELHIVGGGRILMNGSYVGGASGDSTMIEGVGSKLEVTNQSVIAFDSMHLLGGGELEVSGQNSSVAIASSLDVPSGCSLTVSTEGLLQAEGVSVGGILRASGGMILSDVVVQNGGMLNATGQTTTIRKNLDVLAGGWVDVIGGDTALLVDEGYLHNEVGGTVHLNSNTTSLRGTGLFTNEGLLEGGARSSDRTTTMHMDLLNSGTVAARALSASGSTFRIANSQIENSGTMMAEGATLSFEASRVLHTGIMRASSGGTLLFGIGARFNEDVTGPCGSASIDGLESAMTLTNGAKLTLDTLSLTSGGLVEIVGAGSDGPTNLLVNNPWTVGAGSSFAGSSGAVLSGASLTVEGAINAGGFTVEAPVVVADGGSIFAMSETTFDNASGGLLVESGGAIVLDRDNATIGGSSHITNYGTIRGSVPTSNSASKIYNSLTNELSGVIEAVPNGSSVGTQLQLRSGLSNAGVLRADGAKIRIIGETASGDGSIEIADGGAFELVNYNGTPSHLAGDSGNYHSMTIDGDDSAFLVEAGGTAHLSQLGLTGGGEVLLEDRGSITIDSHVDIGPGSGFRLFFGSHGVLQSFDATGSVDSEAVVSLSSIGDGPSSLTFTDSSTIGQYGRMYLASGALLTKEDPTVGGLTVAGLLNLRGCEVDTPVTIAGGTLSANYTNITARLHHGLGVESSGLVEVAGNGVKLIAGDMSIDETSSCSVSNASVDVASFEMDGVLTVQSAVISIEDDLHFGTQAELIASGSSAIKLGGDLLLESTQSTLFDSAAITFDLTASDNLTDPIEIEVGGADLGVDRAGLTDNFALGHLLLSGVDEVAKLVDDYVNAGEGATEALYVSQISFADAGSLLILNGINLYYETLVGDLSQIDTSQGGSFAMLPAKGVPEPGTLALMVVCSIVVLSRRGQRRDID